MTAKHRAEQNTLVALIENPPDGAGCEYVITFSDGRVFHVGDAQDAYWELANALDQIGV